MLVSEMFKKGTLCMLIWYQLLTCMFDVWNRVRYVYDSRIFFQFIFKC